MSKVTVVIPNFNGKKYLDDCLKSLQKQSYKDMDVILVDDGSTDGSPDYVRGHYPEVELIELKVNTGFANAVNVGIKASDGDYVFLLNNDTICDKMAVEVLVKIMDNKKKLFSAQAKMLKIQEPHDIDDCGDLYCALGWAFSPGKDKKNTLFCHRESVTSACAGAAIYRKECFEQVGYFDEVHFCYLEDVDIGYRARLKGFANIMEPGAIVYHAGSASSGSRYNEFKVQLTAGNNLYFIYKNMPALQIAVNFPLIMLGILIKHVFYVRKGLGRAHIRGLAQGFKKIRHNSEKRIHFGAEELRNSVRLQIELWVNLARRALSI